MSENKGNIYMLKKKLESNNLDEKKNAMKMIISAMTCGEDVSPLFAPIIRNMEEDNLELKKLIYLYVINYAKTHPDLIILAINSFIKDAREHKNPILRALAIRTMGCIRVSQITEYLMEPLREALKDEDSYVRKTGVICVIKMYDSNPDLIESLGFLEMLNNLLTDGNAMVVSNTVAALGQISEKKGVNLLIINDFLANRLISALPEATEWGQTYILDALAGHVPSTSQICEDLLDRVASHLSHQNAGIVLSTVRIIIKWLDFVSNSDTIRNMCRRVTPVLVTLMTTEHEFQYVVLKNINIIIQKRPAILESEIKMFFCHFNDPHYIKLEKLEILLKLATELNIDQILHELKEYVDEVDIDFVRKCVRTFGRLAIKLEKVADKCVSALFECWKKKAVYMIQESVIVMRDVFRKYPSRYEGVLSEIFKNIEIINESEAKAAIIWMVGEYAENIQNTQALLTKYLSTFHEENEVVQLALIASIVRFFLINPKQGGPICQTLFNTIIQNCENPDIRDRGYIYWRIIAKNPTLASKLFVSKKPTINDLSYTFESSLLEKLVDGISSLSAIYFARPETFVKSLRDSKNQRWEDMEDDEGQDTAEVVDSTGQTMGTYEPVMKPSGLDQGIGGVDLLGDEPVQAKVDILEDDIFGGPNPLPPQQQINAPQPNNIKIPFVQVLAPEMSGVQNKKQGLRVEAAVQKENLDIYLYLKIQNMSQEQIGNFQLKFNANSYKLAPDNMTLQLNPIQPGSIELTKVKIGMNGQHSGAPPVCPFKVQIALSTSIDVFVFETAVSFSVLLTHPQQRLNEQTFEELMARPNQVSAKQSFPSKLINETIVKKFEDNLLYLAYTRSGAGGAIMFNFYGRTVDGMDIGIRAVIANGNLSINYQAPHPAVAPLVYQAINFISNF